MGFGSIFQRLINYDQGSPVTGGDLNAIQDLFGNQIQLIDVAAGVSDGVVLRRGIKEIPAVETTTSTAGSPGVLLGTPDVVPDIVLPAGGILLVWVSALYKSTSNGRCNLCLEGTPLAYPGVGDLDGTHQLISAETSTGGSFTNYLRMTSTPTGLKTLQPASGTTDAPVRPAGQPMAMSTRHFGAGSDVDRLFFGGPVSIEMDPGTYDVELRWYNIGAGTLSAKERRLRVIAIAF